MTPSDNQASIELTGTRLVAFRFHSQLFTYQFRRLDTADWQKFFAGIVVESETLGKQRVHRLDTRNASLALVDGALASVEGYKTDDGSDLMTWQNWKDRIPYGHRIKAAELLQDVHVSETPREFVVRADTDEVVLSAKWGIAANGGMIEYDGLKHRFRPPSAEDERRFTRASSEARVVGGARNGRTIYPGKQALLVDLYDKLIVSVDGYVIAGSIPSGVAEIREHMDALHKCAAAQELFFTPDQEDEATAA